MDVVERLRATNDIVSEDELLDDVFGDDSEESEVVDTDQLERGVIPTCAGEWRRRPDGKWQFWEEVDDE